MLLTTALDVDGPCISIAIGPSLARIEALGKAGQPIPKPRPVRGLLDTGASISAVDSGVITSLGLTSTGTADVGTPSTGQVPHICDQYDVLMAIYMDHPDVHVVSVTLPVIGVELNHMGIQALIGRDILENALFLFNGKSKQLTLAF